MGGPGHRRALAGNSIGQDRRFIRTYMTELDAFLHYRQVDVTSFKEMVRRWYPEVEQMGASDAHRAMDDIRRLGRQLAYYQAQFFAARALVEIDELTAFAASKDGEDRRGQR